MKFGTVCTGIDGASVAWAPLGWSCAFSSEVDAFCCALLEERWPGVRNYGDVREAAIDEPVDVLIAGTPCQGFSQAGRRKGLDDARSRLFGEFLRVAESTGAEWLVWENVPGVFSTNGGRDFGAVLGALEGLGYGWAYRTLDAQYFGLAQRRRRVFVVGHRRAECAAAVLFERSSVSGDPAPCGAPGSEVAGSITAGFGKRRGVCAEQAAAGQLIAYQCHGSNEVVPMGALRSSGDGSVGSTPFVLESDVSCALAGNHRLDGESETFVAYQCHGNNVGEMGALRSGNGNETGGVPFVFEPRFARNGRGGPGPVAPALRSENGQTGKGDGAPCVVSREGAKAQSGVRRLTPRECERLQGYPDDYTLIEGYRSKAALKAHEIEEMAAYWDLPIEQVREFGATPDGPRYRALGNAFPVPVVRWIGERIGMVSGLAAG